LTKPLPDWLRVEYGIEKPSSKLLALTELDSNTWVSEVKRTRAALGTSGRARRIAYETI
jgi:hypothetical protein